MRLSSTEQSRQLITPQVIQQHGMAVCVRNAPTPGIFSNFGAGSKVHFKKIGGNPAPSINPLLWLVA